MFSRYGIDNLLILIGFSAVLIVVAVLVSRPWITYPLITLGFVVLLLSLWFFRDPERVLHPDAVNHPEMVVCPADGKVVQVVDVDDREYLHGAGIQVSIFLSPLNVHVNRYPVSGVVEHVRYVQGDYLVAWHPKSSELNERSMIGVETGRGKVLFKQITGYLARRIVYETKTGDTAKAGDRFGMMKFGSRMDVILPAGSTVLVREGQTVRAAETLLGRLP
ncbi:MAG: phosphatidylserine decarboxylase family protein [Candidatus Kapaibacterium sp.]